MKFLRLIPILFIFFGVFPYDNLSSAEVKNPKDYKVLSTTNKKLSISNVEYYLKQGDDSIDLSIKEFNEILNEKMIKAEKIALKNVGR